MLTSATVSAPVLALAGVILATASSVGDLISATSCATQTAQVGVFRNGFFCILQCILDGTGGGVPIDYMWVPLSWCSGFFPGALGGAGGSRLLLSSPRLTQGCPLPFIRCSDPGSSDR